MKDLNGLHFNELQKYREELITKIRSLRREVKNDGEDVNNLYKNFNTLFTTITQIDTLILDYKLNHNEISKDEYSREILRIAEYQDSISLNLHRRIIMEGDNYLQKLILLFRELTKLRPDDNDDDDTAIRKNTIVHELFIEITQINKAASDRLLEKNCISKAEHSLEMLTLIELQDKMFSLKEETDKIIAKST